MAFRMLATAAARTALRAPSTSYRFASIATRSSPINTSLASRPSTWAFSPRFYSAAAGLSKQDIEARILDVLKSFEKVDAAKVRALLVVVMTSQNNPTAPEFFITFGSSPRHPSSPKTLDWTA